MTDLRFDWDRAARTGVSEAVLSDGKSVDQIVRIVAEADTAKRSLLLTRLSADAASKAAGAATGPFDYDRLSRTAILDHGLPDPVPSKALIVTAGSSDMEVAREARRTLLFHGHDVEILADCGVAGLWRLTGHIDRLAQAPAIIAVAGMEGALFPVLAGLVPALIIAVPTSVGYGVAEAGKAALSTALATCSPGLTVVNIDNGFGAASALIKILRLGRDPRG
ncbi:MAG: nickel pincer cofactor biosynthesis protein LarB [Inquilinaceae bacterium]